MSSQYKKTFYVMIFLIVQSHCTQFVPHELENSDNVVQEQAQNKDRTLMDIGKDAKSGLNIGIGKIFEGLELIAGHFDISSSGVENLQIVIQDSFQEIKDNLSQQGQAINRMERILNQQQQTLEKQRGEQILRDERLEGQGQILTQIRGQQQQTLEQQRGEQILRDERMEGQGQILTQIRGQQQQMIDKQNELFELIDERKNISNQCEKILERQHKTLARQDETLEKQIETMGRLQNLLPRHNQTLLQRQKRQVGEHSMIDVHEQTFKELNKSIQSQQHETREELRYDIQMAVANISLIISANEEYQYRQMSPLLNDIRIIKDAINRDNEGDNQLRVHLATLLRDLTIITGKLEISNITAVLEFRESIKATLSQVLEALNRQENTLTNQDHKLNQLSQKLDQQGETLVESERTLKQQMTELGPHEGWFEQQQQALQDNTDILRMAMSNISLILCKTQDISVNGAIIYAKDVAKSGADLDNLEHTKYLAIPNPVGSYGYSISHSNGHGNVILFSIYDADIRVFDPSTDSILSQHTASFNIAQMCTIDTDLHVAIQDDIKTLHLLDGEFNSINTYTYESDKYMWDMVYISTHKFLLYECTRNTPYKATIKTIDVSKKSFGIERDVDVQLGNDWPYCAEMSYEQDYVFLASHTVLYRIDLKTKYYTVHPLTVEGGLPYKPGNIHSMYRAGDYVLLGDRFGRILQFNISGRFRQYLDDAQTKQKINSWVRGITERNGKLYVTSDDNKIHIYQ